MIEPGTISVVTISEIRGAARAARRRASWAADAAHVERDVVERLRERHAELLGLQLGADEGRERLGVVARAQREERVAARGAEVHLPQRGEDLLARRAAERLRHALER